MNAHDPDRLMHIVLDGEYTDAEARDLDRLMAADPAVRVRFEELKKFFAMMRRVPDMEPPEELEHHVINEFNVHLRSSGIQPHHSPKERITMNQRVINDQERTVTNQPALPAGNKKKLLVGPTVAAVDLLVAGSYFFDVPPDSTSGTIAPAQRYRADQPTSGDIKLGGQAGKQTTSPTQAGDTRGNAQGGGAQSGAQSGGAQSGGAQSGGAQSGGAQSGGAQSGGAQSGGAQSGGAQSGGVGRN